MESAVAGDCPEFAEPSSLPELSGLDSEHTSGSSGSSSGEYEYNEYEEEETSEEPSQGKDEGNKGAAEAEPTPEAAPTPEAPASPPPSGGGISPG
jgi:hypothetical protein